jgi:hypothetical protein
MATLVKLFRRSTIIYYTILNILKGHLVVPDLQVGIAQLHAWMLFLQMQCSDKVRDHQVHLANEVTQDLQDLWDQLAQHRQFLVLEVILALKAMQDHLAQLRQHQDLVVIPVQ